MTFGGERGVVLIQVALALVVLLGFCGMVIDVGVLSTARAQAQNAADAGALAGATALAFDTAVLAGSATVEQGAIAAASRNLVWGETPIVTATALYETVPTCVVPGVPPPPTPARVNTCVTVRVYRNQMSGNPLPTFFGRLFEVTEQGVQAQAIGMAAPANSVSCVWPVAIPDKWDESTDPLGSPLWSPTSTFTKYSMYPTLATPRDTYTAPTTTSINSGFSINREKLNADIPQLTLAPVPTAVTTPITAGGFVPVVVPRLDGGGFTSSLASCNGIAMHIGDTLALDLTPGTLAQVLAAASARVTADPGASWNGTTLRIAGSCATAPSPCAAISPRLVALPVFDVDRYETTRQATGTPEIRVVNFVGFFIQSVTPGVAIVGRLATYPGNVYPGAPAVGYLSAFLRAGILRR